MPMQIRFREGRVEQAEIGTHIIGSQHLANNAVSYASQIKDGIIGYAELTTGLQGSLGGGAPGPNTIGTTQLKEPSVGSSQLYAPAVGSQNIYSQAVYGAKIKNNSVGSQQLANAGVISTKIANDAVGSQHLANDAVSYETQIKDNIIGYSELTTGLQGSLGGVIPPDSIGTTELKEPAVESVNIYDDAVGSQHLSGGKAPAVAYADQIKNNLIGSQHLANNAVSYNAQIKDGIIGYGELTTGLQGTINISCMFTQTAPVTVANTAAETTLVGAGAGTDTLRANLLTVGKTVRITASGHYSTAGTGLQTLTMRIRFGGIAGTIVLTITALGAALAMTNRGWRIIGEFTCCAAGAVGDGIAQGIFFRSTSATAANVCDMVNAVMSILINTTVAQRIVVSADWNSAAAGDTITCTNLMIEVLN